jgi:two-component system chemotaxis response regulator CheY
MLKLNDVLVLDYLVESREDLATAEKDLLAIESERDNLDEERINRICLALHSVKGGSLLFDLVTIAELAQKTENAVAKIRFQSIAPTHARVSVLLHAIDRLNELILEPDTSNEADISGLMAELAMPDASLQASFEKGGATEDKPVNGTRDRLRILIVEDDLACRLLLQTFLARYGECHVALNGREAVDLFRTSFDRGSSYDLICMDVMMPEMDGREAVRQIRAFEEDRRIRSPYGATIFMTTTVQEIREVFQCFRELCDAYLLKPIDLGQLLTKMKFFELVR